MLHSYFCVNVIIHSTLFFAESQDIIPPTVTCPPDQQVTVEDNKQSAIVDYPPATAEDNRGATVAITYSRPSGSAFSVGTSVVKVTATDEAGNIAHCKFTVTVSGET